MCLSRSVVDSCPGLISPAELGLDVLLVTGQSIGKRGELLPDDVADPGQQSQAENNRHDNGGGPGKAASLEDSGHRGQGEAQQHRQGQRLEHFAREVHEGNDREDQDRDLKRIGHGGTLALIGHGESLRHSIGKRYATSDKPLCNCPAKPNKF